MVAAELLGSDLSSGMNTDGLGIFYTISARVSSPEGGGKDGRLVG